VLIADLGYRVTVPDVRGRGESDRAASGQYRLTDYAADVAGLVAALNLRTPAVLGHSMGARIAAAYCVLHAVPLLTVPVAGHMVPWDNLEGFLDAVRPHLLTHLHPAG